MRPASATMAKDTKGITVKKQEDMPEWYSQVCIKAGLAEHSPVRGCMIIKPLGYSLWQGIMDSFNEMLAEDNVKNAYFPLFIPESFFKKEAEHAEGFKPEVAWVAKDEGERLALRPTSETIIHDSFSSWIRSWRDLPMKINQWSNTIRWEVQDTKLFLRTREFLWQEGHCAYATEKERNTETRHFLERYRQVAEELLAVPVILGEKTEEERFPGADRTYTIESLMPDGKALQMGTSHDLSQGFPKSFNITFQDKNEKPSHPYLNSWGISTRLIGALVLTHADDRGLVLPPRIAPNKVALVPIIFEDSKEKVIAKLAELGKQLQKYKPIVDTQEEYSSGWKFAQYELTGVPLRIELGPKDLEKQHVVVVRRDTGEKAFVPWEQLPATVEKLLEQMQQDMLAVARGRMQQAIITPASFEEFEKAVKEKKMLLTTHCGSSECEIAIKEKTAATARCIPFNSKKEGKCIHCGKPARYHAYFARSY